MTTLKPTAAIPPNEQVTRVEDLVFGGGDGENARCAITNRRFENGSGAQDHETQSRRFIAEAALAERKGGARARGGRTGRSRDCRGSRAYAGAAPGQGAMSARLISNSPEFYRAVEVLREFDPPIKAMVMFAAMTWDAERLKQARADGDLPGNDAALSQQRTVN